MKGSIGDKQRLEHILDACEKISIAITGYDADKFIADFIVGHAVSNLIMIIGEASGSISKEFKDKHEEFDWMLMKGMRNFLVHVYFGIDYEKVYQTALFDIPVLKVNCINALKELK